MKTDSKNQLWLAKKNISFKINTPNGQSTYCPRAWFLTDGSKTFRQLNEQKDLHGDWLFEVYVLTLDFERDPFADGRGYAVRGYAQISAHVQPTHSRDVQHFAVDEVDCNRIWQTVDIYKSVAWQ